MPNINLPELLRGETDRIEYKESFKDAKAILCAVCALANDLSASGQPGFVVLGVNKGGSILGVGLSNGGLDQAQQALSSQLTSSKLFPNPTVTIRVVDHAEKVVVVLEVSPYRVPPVVTCDGTAYVRIGSTTRRASETDLTRLRERRPEASQAFDSRCLLGADLDSLQTQRFREDFEADRAMDSDPGSFPTMEQWLGAHRQLGQFRNGRWIPYVGAILTYGVSPQDYLPGAFLECARYAGILPDAPLLLRKTLTGPLSVQMERAWDFVTSQVVTREPSTAEVRAPAYPDYPLEALKELVRNLVQHRLYEGTNAPGRIEWYDDRIEFSNPGGPYGQASEGEFGSHSDYRNPLVTRELVRLGYVQRLGRGIRLTREQLRRNGNPPLEAETNGFTRIIVRARP